MKARKSLVLQLKINRANEDCAVMLKNYFFILNILLVTQICYAEIPIVVISAGKSIQSKSTVGSDIEVITRKQIQNSNHSFLADILDEHFPGINFSRVGGNGTNTLVQLRGLPKRYTTIYIDGIKLSDPSTPDNAYYLDNLTSDFIDRVEILKGNQSSLYGSGAIGGTINIFTKKGSAKSNSKSSAISYGSKDTKKLNFSFDKSIQNHYFFFNLNKYLTDGVSAMDDNQENDSYRNDGLHANHSYKINNRIKIENNIRIVDSFLNYDQAGTTTDFNSTDSKEYSYSFKVTDDNKKLKNQLSYNKGYFKRVVGNNTKTSKATYYGYRDSINLLSQYNFSNDKRLVIGLDNEFDAANFDTWATSGNLKTDEAVYSQYFDYQFRPFEKLYTTIGARQDYHTTAGRYQTGRMTFAFMQDNLTKYRSSLGTGIRFATLNDYFYDTNVKEKEIITPEKSYNIDFGLDKKIPHLNLDLTFNLFYTEYDDNIANWKSNTQSGSSYTIANSGGRIISKGFEIVQRYKFDNMQFKFGYVFTDAYDGEDCDDPGSSCIDEMPVRVPRHFLSSNIRHTIDDYSFSLIGKFNSERRDYGNSNNGFAQVILDPYSVFDFNVNYKINSNYVIFFNLQNIFNENYHDAYQYSVLGRDFTFGLKQTF